MYRNYFFFILFLFFCVRAGYSYGNYFDSLKTDPQIMLVDSVIKTFVIKECCDTTIDPCFTEKPACSIAQRFFNFSSWLVLKNEPFTKCIEQLNKRSASFFGPDTCSFTPPVLAPAGEASSPIIITAFVSASCPLCKKVCIPLYLSVTNGGPLTGKAILSLKPISADIGNRALAAANKQGKFWEFFLYLENEKRRLDDRIVRSIAKKIGLNGEQFNNDLTDHALIIKLLDSQKEALTHDVSITPTLFINKRRYQSYKDPQWVIDAVEFEYDKIKNLQKK